MKGSARSFRAAVVVAALFALVLVPVQLTAGPVEAAVPTGAISGTVTNNDGAPLAGIVVSADT